MDFISKYSKHDSDNCFLDLDSQLNNITRYYDNEENFDESEIQYVETLREEDVARAKGRFSKKKNGKRGTSYLATLNTWKKPIPTRLILLCKT